MKFRSIISFIGFLALVSLGACNKFLGVKPDNQFLESQLFSTPAGVRSALNEAYLEMAGNALYGGNLTMSTLELMGQHYQAPRIPSCSFTDSTPSPIINPILNRPSIVSGRGPIRILPISTSSWKTWTLIPALLRKARKIS